MIIDGQTIVDRNMVMFPNDGYEFDTAEQEQPNGLDLRVTKIGWVTGKARLSRDHPMDYSQMNYTPVEFKEGWAKLQPHQQYLVDFREQINVTEGFTAWIITRSSLLRSGIMCTSALWDTGFSGRLGASLRTLNSCEIQFGARLAQVVFSEAEFNGKRYEGIHQNTDSQAVFI